MCFSLHLSLRPKKRNALRDALHLREVFSLVSCDPQFAAQNQRSRNCAQEFFRDDAAILMPPFRPRVRKKEMKHINGLPWKKVLNRVENIDSHNARVR